MATNKQIEVGARSIGKDRELPGGGSKKLSRIVHDHLHWFDAAEARGLTWSDMIRLLSANGVVGGNGKPLSVGTLSSTVWRERAEVNSLEEEASARSVRRTRPAPSKRVTKLAKFESDVQTKLNETNSGSGKSASDGHPLGEQPAPGKDNPNLSKPRVRQATALTANSPSRPIASQSKKDVIAFMNRAASVRRRSDDN
jgi:hypothetical protein